MDTHTSSRRALKLAQEQAVAEDQRRPRSERDRAWRAAETSGTKEGESEGREVVLGTLLKLIVKDKLLHSGKVPVNTELRPLRREKWWTEVQRYGSLNETMKIWWNNLNFYTELPHIFPHPFIISYLSFHCPRETGFNDTKEHHATRKLLIWVHWLLFYHTLHMDIAISMYLLKVTFVTSFKLHN